MKGVAREDAATAIFRVAFCGAKTSLRIHRNERNQHKAPLFRQAKS
jgi:hypothetical protein